MATPNLDALALIQDKIKHPTMGQNIPAGEENRYHSFGDFNTVKGSVLETKDIIDNIFNNLTDEQAKQISNYISDLSGFRITKSAYNLHGNYIKILANGNLGFKIIDSNNTPIFNFISEDFPITFTSEEEKDFNLPNDGTYLVLNYNLDGVLLLNKAFKILPSGEDFGTINKSFSISANIQDLGGGDDLINGTPINFTVSNVTSFSKDLFLSSNYKTESLSSNNSSSAILTPFINYNYVSVLSTSIDMTSESQNIMLKIYHADSDTTISEITLIAGKIYPSIDVGFVNADDFTTHLFEIIIEYV
jgi:hypothetical protein